jgi:phosphoenolpyruvate-protein kinase (PTS system EI component)
MGLNEEFQGAINRVREDIAALRERMLLSEHKTLECERRHDMADKRHDHLCETLNKTKDSIEAKIEKNSEDNKKQTDIIIEKIGLLMTDREVRKEVEEVKEKNEQKAIGIIKYLPKFLVFLAAAAFTTGIIWATKQ